MTFRPVIVQEGSFDIHVPHVKVLSSNYTKKKKECISVDRRSVARTIRLIFKMIAAEDHAALIFLVRTVRVVNNIKKNHHVADLIWIYVVPVDLFMIGHDSTSRHIATPLLNPSRKKSIFVLVRHHFAEVCRNTFSSVEFDRRSYVAAFDEVGPATS